MRILFFLLFPIFLSAQINRAYGVIEIGSFPTSSPTGPKFAYRPVDSSFYRWVSGNTWVKVVEPSIVPDTLYLKQLSGTTALVDGDTIDISTYLLKTDTTYFLGSYIRLAGYGLLKTLHTLTVDTSLVSTKTYTNRFLLKSDTTTAFASYLKRPVGWGLSLLSGKYPLVDSFKVATRYYVGANFFPLQGGTLTGTGGAGFIGFPSQVSAPGTPASGLNVYAQGSSFNWKGTDGFERQFASTLTGGRTYTLPDVSGTFALGTGTTNLVPLWTATNTLGSSNIQDNGTAVSILNSKPFLLGQWTTAGRPTGVAGQFGYNTSLTALEWYNGIRVAFGLESTFARGTSARVPFFDANGQVTDNANLKWDSSTDIFYSGASHVTFRAVSHNNNTSRFIVGTGTAGTGGICINCTSSNSGIAIGYNATSANNSVAIGAQAISGSNGFAFGVNSNAAANAFAVGDGVNAGATRSVAIGDRTVSVATGNFVAGSAGGNSTTFTNVYFGSGVQRGNYFGSTNGDGVAYTINGSGGLGTNFAGGNITIAGGKGTGTGTAGDVIFSTSTTGSSGSVLQSLTQRWWVKGQTGRLGNTTSPNYLVDVTSTDAFGLPRGTVAQRPTIVSSTTPFRFNTDSTALEYGESVGTWRLLATRAYARSLVNAISTSNFANTNLTATGNRTHDWANYNFTWSNMKKLMWGADSLFKITKEYSGYTYAVMRSPGGQVLMDLQGNNNISTNSVEIRLTDTETNNQFLLSHDNKGTGTDGFRIEHYNAINHHNSLFIDKASRLFNVNNSFLSAGTRFSATSTINTGISSNIVRGSEYVSGTDSIAAVHFFQAVSNQSKNKDVFGVYSNVSTVDTMYFRIGKTGIGYFYKNLVLGGYGVGNKEDAGLGKTQSNYVAGFATDGTVLDLNVDTLLKKEKYFTITSTSSPQTLSNNFSDNLINQGSTQATFTLTFPASPVDGQVLKITYNNAITTLTLDGNGNTIVGSAVTTGVAGSQRAFKFYTGIGWIKLY